MTTFRFSAMKPEERANAIAEHVGPLPRPVREELEHVVASAIRRE